MEQETNNVNNLVLAQKPLSLKEKVDTIFDSLNTDKKSKKNQIKKMKLPRKAKVRKSKLKKGFVGILRVDENGNITGEKQRMIGSAYRSKEGTYHASDGREILFWEGKFPILIQQSWRQNPIRIRKEEKDKNETYGQPYIMARMLGDTIKVKQKPTNILIWVLILGAVAFAASQFF